MSPPPLHARRPRSIGTVLVLLLSAALLGGIGYRSCAQASPAVPDAGASQPDASQEAQEYGVTQTRFYQYAGTMDVENRYASTVMISTVSQTTQVRCSGVLISPRVVLTSASCLCEPAQRPGNNLSCLERAVATTVIYGDVLNREFPEDTAQMRFHSYEGTVRPHPTADLAVIVLDEAVKDVAPEPLMEQGEFQAQEPLIMAGYASSGTPQAAGGIYGIRYFRKNTVTRVPPEEPGTVLYEQPGAALYDGYTGGPCFREDSQRRWLAGVAKTGGGQDLSFTSVLFFREWVQAQLR